MGDPTKASAEKGRVLLDAAAGGIVELIDEMRSRRAAVRTDRH
jgi:creatinine amidohydrolase/Fe(II)-dependent formamide hydrolase-like protein